MGVVEEIVGRLMLAAVPQDERGKSLVSEDRHGVRKHSKVQIVERQVIPQPHERPSSRPTVEPVGGETGSTSEPSGSVVDREWVRQATGLDPSESVDSVAAVHVYPPAEEHLAVQRLTMQETRDLRAYAIGGGELGREGVTPTEIAGYRHGAAGPRARLVAAIDDYLSDGMTRHAAGLIRQGIAWR